METTREFTTGGPIEGAPGHYIFTVTVEGDDEREWKFVRKPDGTYWDVASTDLCPFRVFLGDQIVDAKALRLCERHYARIREAEAATVKVLDLRKLANTEPQRYELCFYDTAEQTRGYVQTTRYGTEAEIREMLKRGGMPEGRIDFHFLRAGA